MPELPEVETVRRVLEPQLRGRAIEDINLIRPEVVAHPAAAEFRTVLLRQHFASLDRRGKFLLMRLESGDNLALHLRMTGQLLCAPPDLPREKHTHVVFTLDDGNELRFTDLRRFGRFWLLRAGEADDYTGMAKLGPEPFGANLDAAYLRAKRGGSRLPVKTMLLDQSVVAGIGNIYSDEILFAAGIAPERPCNTLAAEEWARLAETIPAVLRWGVESNRVTAAEYLAGKGADYRNTPLLKVYGRAGAPCTRCGAPLCRVVLGGRGGCYCPNCQK